MIFFWKPFTYFQQAFHFPLPRTTRNCWRLHTSKACLMVLWTRERVAAQQDVAKLYNRLAVFCNILHTTMLYCNSTHKTSMLWVCRLRMTFQRYCELWNMNLSIAHVNARISYSVTVLSLQAVKEVMSQRRRYVRHDGRISFSYSRNATCMNFAAFLSSLFSGSEEFHTFFCLKLWYESAGSPTILIGRFYRMK